MTTVSATVGANEEPLANPPASSDLPICGIVRPIASMGESYPESHWTEVHEIVAEAARSAGYRLRLVSDSDQVGIIVSEIVRNLNENPIVVVDVSSRNPNVMFELGMRITFQKPVVIITDDHTPFSFDIQAIRHVQYRRDLRTAPTRRFQNELSSAIKATVEAASKANYRGYLQQFGKIEVADLGDQQISLDELAQSVQDLRLEIRSSNARKLQLPVTDWRQPVLRQEPFTVTVPAEEAAQVDAILQFLPVKTLRYALADGKFVFSFPTLSEEGETKVREEVGAVCLRYEIR